MKEPKRGAGLPAPRACKSERSWERGAGDFWHAAYGGRQAAQGIRHTAGSGFTLVELLATIAVIMVVAGLTMGTLGYVNRKGAEGRAKAEVAAIAAAIDSFKLDHGQYPPVASLYQELTGQGQINPGKVYFEPKSNMVTDLRNGPLLDPWGVPYKYRTNNLRNVGFFDFWTEPPNAKNEADWIHN